MKPNSLVKKSNIWSLVMSTVGNSNAWSCFGAVGQSVRPHSNVVSGNGVHSDLNPILLLKRISKNGTESESIVAAYHPKLFAMMAPHMVACTPPSAQRSALEKNGLTFGLSNISSYA